MGFGCLFVLFLFCTMLLSYDNIVDISQFSLLIFLTGSDEFLRRKLGHFMELSEVGLHVFLERRGPANCSGADREM